MQTEVVATLKGLGRIIEQDPDRGAPGVHQLREFEVDYEIDIVRLLRKKIDHAGQLHSEPLGLRLEARLRPLGRIEGQEQPLWQLLLDDQTSSDLRVSFPIYPPKGPGWKPVLLEGGQDLLESYQ